MIRLCVFNTFDACKEAQHYDHIYQKAIKFAMVTSVNINIIRQNNLHVQDENGVFPLDQYILDNDIEVEFREEYEREKIYWRGTIAWSNKYKLGNDYVYLKDHSDRDYDIIEVESLADCILLDDEGNEVIKEEVFI
jgi:hypothetical protein